jgi:hypothetical protein
MRSRRFIALLIVAALGLAAIVAAAVDRSADGASFAGPPHGVLPTPSAAAGTPPQPAPTLPGADAAPAATSGSETLEAVQTLKRFCDLVDDGDKREAGRLLAGPWVWPRRGLARIARLRFMSARVRQARVSAEIVLLTRVSARLRHPSPLHDGVNQLFFTLGRDGTTGGWLITAVTTSPWPERKGSP